MGSEVSKESSAAILQDLITVEHVDDNRFGPVNVCKSKTNGALVYVRDTGLVLEAKIDMDGYLPKIKDDRDYYRIFSTLNFTVTNKQPTFGYCT